MWKFIGFQIYKYYNFHNVKGYNYNFKLNNVQKKETKHYLHFYIYSDILKDSIRWK